MSIISKIIDFNDKINDMCRDDLEKIFDKSLVSFCKKRNKNKHCLLYLGFYYQFIAKDYDKMMKIYHETINRNCHISMSNLGYYYKHIMKDYEKMEKYYLMAIEFNDSSAMNNLGDHHFDITRDYEKMEKYYLMAIELNYSPAMNNLGYYHYRVTKDYEKMEKYYLMAIKLNDSDAMINFGVYYRKIGDYEKMGKYFLMAIENNYDILSLLVYYKNDLKFYLLLDNINNKNDTVNKKFNELKNTPKVKKYLEQLEKCDKTQTMECIICYTDREYIEYECGHKVCPECYIETSKCYYNCGLN